MFNSEKFEIWHRAIDFADLVNSATRGYPTDERFGLTNQMRRAAVPISSKSFPNLQFLSAWLFFPMKTTPIYAAEEQSRMLSGLRKALLPE